MQPSDVRGCHADEVTAFFSSVVLNLFSTTPPIKCRFFQAPLTLNEL